MHRGKRFPLAVMGQLSYQVTPPHSKQIHSGKRTSDMSATLKRGMHVGFMDKWGKRAMGYNVAA